MTYNVLFLCTGNSARSILAEAILNRIGRGRFRAWSAGSHPKGEVDPHALDLLQRLDYDVSQFRSKSWNEFVAPDAPKLKFVLTLCDVVAGEICPNWPGQPITAHWGMADPAATVGPPAEVALAFAETYRLLDNRLSLFASLKTAGLDRLALQKSVAAIGTKH
jgi:protein-tyrosine-phosphatase